VWVNLARKDPTADLPERIFAAGEEKTIMRLPNGYGYEYKASDGWLINYMIHNLTPKADDVYITYDIDFIPADSPLAAGIKKARPVWMDVENGNVYPVFDALKGSGADGQFVYPDDVPGVYENRPQRGNRRRRGEAPATTAPPRSTRLNEWTVDEDGVLIGTAGHLHPGGLHTDLHLTRAGASATPGSEAAAAVDGEKAHLFRSEAVYYEPAGAVSWDVSMTATPPDWKVRVKKGDVLSTSATYDTRNASWYESMGIMVVWMTVGDEATAGPGDDPYATKVAVKGDVTHGHLAENDNHGGEPDPSYQNLLELPSRTSGDTVAIADYVYGPGDMQNSTFVPSVAPGQPLKFVNYDDTTLPTGLWHTVTACKAPCDRSTGIAYPLADADRQFDSGELGTGGPPTADRIEWSIPSDLEPGTYTYFCRIHPFMRGGFRVEE
jgi:plastocyanin